MDKMSHSENNIQSRILNCFAFITFGTCYYGKLCRFYHPNPEEVAAIRRRGMSHESPAVCKFFIRGVCKFGESCRFSHSLPVVPNLQLHFNTLGLPRRSDANTCAFYMCNGVCGFGVACKFDHPEPVNQQPLQWYGSYAADELAEHQHEAYRNSYGLNGEENQWPEPANFYYPGAESIEYDIGYPEDIDDWNGNGSSYVQQPEPIYYPPVEYNGVNGNGSPYYVQQPEPAIYYPPVDYNGVTNGQYGNGNQARTDVVMEPVTLSDVGLPLRPGKRVCLHYQRSGVCKYGSRCKFDHPVALSSNDEGSVSGSKTANAPE